MVRCPIDVKPQNLSNKGLKGLQAFAQWFIISTCPRTTANLHRFLTNVSTVRRATKRPSQEADAKLGHFESHERAVIEDIRKAPAAQRVIIMSYCINTCGSDVNCEANID